MFIKEGAILDHADDQHKAPWRLTGEEVHELMEAYTRDKVCVTEADCLTLCRWAETCKRGAWLLAWTLDGHMAVTVDHGSVTLAPLPGSPHSCV